MWLIFFLMIKQLHHPLKLPSPLDPTTPSPVAPSKTSVNLSQQPQVSPRQPYMVGPLPSQTKRMLLFEDRQLFSAIAAAADPRGEFASLDRDTSAITENQLATDSYKLRANLQCFHRQPHEQKKDNLRPLQASRCSPVPIRNRDSRSYATVLRQEFQRNLLMANFIASQLKEIATDLEASGHQFI
ncbi:hypothetical protein D5086_006133 [Populus alba]|uniref:Uncharacterized protein n=1 Tax=Populus alba TaxID=43335 RepID=A0ACC4CKX9_POPAL